ncbi:MAG: FGGY family carbohydrate kinase, partial [Chloroflexia bacterium]
MNKPVVLTIDIGSSSVRANLFGADARQLVKYETQVHYAFDTTGDGGVEMATAKLVEAVFSAVDGTLGKAGKLADAILGVGMCSLVPNVVGVDVSGRAVTPIYIWADTRSSLQAEELKSRSDDSIVREQTGCPIHPSYLPAKLMWIRETMPEKYSKVRKWLSLGDFVYLQLFGEARQSLSVASWSGLLNRHTLGWDVDVLGAIGVEADYLPELVDVGEPSMGLKGEFAARWPQLRDVPWYSCVGDGVTSNLGSGCVGADEVAVQVGTSGAMRALVAGEVRWIPMGLWCYRMDRKTALL